MAGEFWLDDAQWAAIEPLLPTNRPGASQGRSSDHQRHHPCLEGGLSVAGLPGRLRSPDDDLQPLSSVVAAGDLAAPIRCAGHRQAGRRADDRQHDGQGASLGGRRKRGADPRRSAALAAGERQKSMLLSMLAAVPSRCR